MGFHVAGATCFIGSLNVKCEIYASPLITVKFFTRERTYSSINPTEICNENCPGILSLGANLYSKYLNGLRGNCTGKYNLAKEKVEQFNRKTHFWTSE